MSSENPAPEYSLLQRELFKVTGLAFDTKIDEHGVSLFQADIHVFTLPLSVLYDPSKTIPQYSFPQFLKDGPTLPKRCALLRTMSMQTRMLERYHGVLDISSDTSICIQLQKIRETNRKIFEEICKFVWNLDDVTLYRLVQ